MTFAIFNKDTDKFLQHYEIVPDKRSEKFRIFVVGLSYIRKEEFDTKEDAESWIKSNDKIYAKKSKLSYHLDSLE